MGKLAEIEEIIPGKMREKAKVICKHENEKIVVLKEHFFVVGRDKPLIKVSK